MGRSFDPYYKWLGIPPEEQPPNHYRLLGITDFETDPDVVQAAADQRMAHLRTHQTGQYADWSQRLLNEVASAKICLLSPIKKAAYDEQLREAMRPPAPPVQSSEPTVAPVPSFDVGADESRPRASSVLRSKRQLPLGLIIGVVMVLSLVVVIELLNWSRESPEVAVTPSAPSDQPANPDGQTDARAEERPATAGAKEEIRGGNANKKEKTAEPGHVSVPKRSEENKPLRPAAVPSGSPASPVSPAERSSPVNVVPRPNLEFPGFQAAGGNSPNNSPAVRPEPPPKLPTAETGDRRSAKGAALVPEQGEAESRVPDRASVPSAAAQDEAMKLARDLYKNDFAKAKTAEDKQALAKKLLAQAEAAASADAGSFALLRLARDVAAQSSNSETALAAIELMSERYAIDALEMKAEMLSTCAKKAKTPPQHLSVAEQAVRLLDEATTAGDYVQAVNLAKLAETEGKLSRNRELVQRAKACLLDLQKKAKFVAEFEAARNTLATEPEDPVANLTVGIYYGCLQGDWKKALPHLAKGSDADLQTLAKQELTSPPTGVDTQVALADAWWDAGQNAEAVKRLGMLRRAGTWYAKAQADAPGGLSKVKVERRLEELAKAEHDAAGPKPGLRPSVPVGKWFSLLASPNELTGWETTDCRFSYANRVIDLRGREMYCPIVAKDVTIRAKVKRHYASRIRLIVRNSDQGCYVAQLTNNNWSIIRLNRNQRGGNQAANWTQWGAENTLGRIPVTRNYSDMVFEMGFAVAGNTLTVFLNRQPLLQAKDAAFTEGTVGIGTDDATGLFLTDIELLIPNKGSFVADQRVPAGAAKPRE